jgi:hypothetical protein
MDIRKCQYCDNLIPQLGGNRKGCYVECERCGARTGYFPTSVQAIKEWNAGNNNPMNEGWIQNILKNYK